MIILGLTGSWAWATDRRPRVPLPAHPRPRRRQGCPSPARRGRRRPVAAAFLRRRRTAPRPDALAARSADPGGAARPRDSDPLVRAPSAAHRPACRQRQAAVPDIPLLFETGVGGAATRCGERARRIQSPGHGPAGHDCRAPGRGRGRQMPDAENAGALISSSTGPDGASRRLRAGAETLRQFTP
jgi:hypothetical protein